MNLAATEQALNTLIDFKCQAQGILEGRETLSNTSKRRLERLLLILRTTRPVLVLLGQQITERMAFVLLRLFLEQRPITFTITANRSLSLTRAE